MDPARSAAPVGTGSAATTGRRRHLLLLQCGAGSGVDLVMRVRRLARSERPPSGSSRSSGSPARSRRHVRNAATAQNRAAMECAVGGRPARIAATIRSTDGCGRDRHAVELYPAVPAQRRRGSLRPPGDRCPTIRPCWRWCPSPTAGGDAPQDLRHDRRQKAPVPSRGGSLRHDSRWGRGSARRCVPAYSASRRASRPPSPP